MHDTVARIRRQIRDEAALEGVGDLVSARLQGAGLSLALSEPLSAQIELLYLEAFRWLKQAQDLGAAPGVGLAELYYASQHLYEVLGDLIPFLERAEDTLSEREEITHRESGYEREVAPFSRIESTQDLRRFLNGLEPFAIETASAGAVAEGDLMKVVYMAARLQDATPKPADLYAIVAELLLDSRRHLRPTFKTSAEFMTALQAAAHSVSG